MPPATPPTTNLPQTDMGDFVHLHLHTEYSLLDGGNRIDKLVARVAELGMKAVGVTDHGNIFGAVAFYTACKEKGIKPILGVEAYVTPPGKPRQDRTYSGGGEGGYHLVLLAETDEGWRNLLVLCSEAYLTGFYYKPRIDRELLAKHSAGLIAINGHLGSEIGEHLLAYERSGDEKHWAAAYEAAEWGKRTFGKWSSGQVVKWSSEEEKTGNGGSSGSSATRPLDHSTTRPLPSFFIELQHHVPEQNAINKHLIRLARELELPLVCDNDSHFLRAEDHDSHDTLICISTGKSKVDTGRMRYPREVYVKSPAEMAELFEEYGEAGREALANTVAIAERCNVTLPLGVSHAPMVRVRVGEGKRAESGERVGGIETWPLDELPRHDDAAFGGDLTAWYQAYCACFEVVPFQLPDGIGEEEKKGLLAEAKGECDKALHLLAEAGMAWRYGPAVPHEAKSEESSTKARIKGGRASKAAGGAAAPASITSDSSEASDSASGASASPETARLQRELKILCDKNIAAYFLIVWDFVNWGRQHGVPALARGSGVGTMVGYVLGLSNACPVKYGLLFERFTDPDRSEYPDIDIDLCQDGRGAVINYVRQKYGHVAQIITFGTLKARAAIRDVGRVLDMPLSEVDKIAKLIPETLGMTLEEALIKEPDLKKLYDREAVVRQLIDNAMGIEGQARHASVHAAGVIVATRPLHEIVPLFRAAGSAEHEVVTQWDGPTCEKMGLLKMDFLGLRTISTVARALQLIREGLSERDIWEAVGRGEEYQKWQSGRVAKWHGDGDESEASEDHNVSRPAGVAAGNGHRAGYVPGDQGDAAQRDVRTDKSTAPRHNINSDEHRGGVRQAHTTIVHPRSADGDGIAVRSDDRVRASDQYGDDTRIGADARAARRRGPVAALSDTQTGGKGASGRQEASHEGEVIDATLPLRHSATSPLHIDHPLDLDRLSFADPNVFHLFQRGETTGIFQFESGGMRRLLTEMKPDRLEDLIAANALFRPGPMDLIPDYNRRKHGQEAVPEVHEVVDRYTAETYGVMVYQEQVMQIVHGLGGIKLRDAYSLIKNISKKKHDKIEKERPKFVEGAQQKGLTKAGADELFELILKFAGYGFNKSHSTGYAIVAYQTAYLKTYFPNQYMAAFLTFESGANKVSDWIPYLDDCRRTRFVDPVTGKQIKVGVEVRPPDINLSLSDFSVVFEGEGAEKQENHKGAEAQKEKKEMNEARTSSTRLPQTGATQTNPPPGPFSPGGGGQTRASHGHVRFGLKALKGAGDKAIEAVIEERLKSGPFTSLFDFCERMPPGCVNKATLEALVKCGAFDSVHSRAARSAMVATIEQALSAGQRAAADKAAGQAALFGMGAAAAAKAPVITLAKSEPWSEAETLTNEKDALGFYVSSHPLDHWKSWAGIFTTTTAAGIKEMQQDQRAVIAAMVQSVRPIIVRNGKSAGQKMAIVTVEDMTGACECALFTDAFAKFGHLAEVERVVFVLGRVDLKRGEPQLIIDRLVPIDGVPLEGGRLRLMLDEVRLNGGAVGALTQAAAIVRGKPGTGSAALPVELVIGTQEQVAILSADAKMRVMLEPDLVKALELELGAGMVRLVGGVAFEKTEKERPWERRGQKAGSFQE